MRRTSPRSQRLLRCILAVTTLAFVTTCAREQTTAQQPSTAAPQKVFKAPAVSPTSPRTHRIVSLSPAATEALFAVGCGAQLVARDGWSDFPAAARKVPALKGLVPSAEAVLATRPTLVLTHFPPERLVKPLRAAGVEVLALSPQTLKQISETFVTIGERCGAADAGAKLKERFMRAFAERGTTKDGPRVYLELDPGGGRPHTVGGASFIHALIAAAGGQGLFPERGAWLQVSAEEVLIRKPELVVLTGTSPMEDQRRLAKRPGWNSCAACAADRVRVVHPDLLTRPGPRLVEGLKLLRRWVRDSP